eukprot:8242000-Pyramimonas_sp.AAC.1
MEDGPFSKCGFRFSATYLEVCMQELHGWRVRPFEDVALASAPRAFLLKTCNSFTVSRNRMVEIPRKLSPCNLGFSGRNSHVDSRR